MKKIQLPEKVRRFLVPGVLLLVVFFIAGGFYFRQRSLSFIPRVIPEEKGEGEISGARTAVPQNFPQDIPLFEPAEVLSSLESQERIQITLQTTASTERIQKFYRQEMKGLGWRLTGRGAADDNGVFTFTKTGRQTQIVITSGLQGPILIVLTTNP